MDLALLVYPLVLAGALKIVGAAIAIVMGIPFIIGIVIGWLVRGAV